MVKKTPAKKETKPAKQTPSPRSKKTRAAKATPATTIPVERIQTGVRIEKRILKVLKALAELTDLALGDLIEGIVLHAFDGKPPFGPETMQKIGELKRIYGLELDATASHRLRDAERPSSDRRGST